MIAESEPLKKSDVFFALINPVCLPQVYLQLNNCERVSPRSVIVGFLMIAESELLKKSDVFFALTNPVCLPQVYFQLNNCERVSPRSVIVGFL